METIGPHVAAMQPSKTPILDMGLNHCMPLSCFMCFFLFYSGSHLLSRAVSSEVPSAAWALTIVFGMGTGVSPKRIATGNIIFAVQSHSILLPLCPASSSAPWADKQ